MDKIYKLVEEMRTRSKDLDIYCKCYLYQRVVSFGYSYTNSKFIFKKFKEALNYFTHDDYINYQKIENHFKYFDSDKTEKKFENFLYKIMDFYEYYDTYVDPRFENDENIQYGINKDTKFITIENDLYTFTISFEVTAIPKSGSYSLFDSIVGLDKAEKNIIFTTITITNKKSNNNYEYKFTVGDNSSYISFDSEIYEKHFLSVLEDVGNILGKFLCYYSMNKSYNIADIIDIIKNPKNSKCERVIEGWKRNSEERKRNLDLQDH